MLTRRTVFVIGAGASHELDFPTGDKLKDTISGLLDIKFPDGYNQSGGDFEICELLRKISRDSNKPDINYLLRKCWLIRDALPGSISIDNLLDAHRNDADLVKIGKLAIAKSILQAERSSKLFKKEFEESKLRLSDVSDTWLVPLLQMLTEGVAKEDAGIIFENTTFINFNYDRSLEYFLPKALKLYFGIDEQEADLISRKARIFHPYGHVGKADAKYPLDSVKFGSERYDLSQVAGGIQTFTEGLADEHLDLEIKESIEFSDQIIFLGFAFHPINLEILTCSNTATTKRIFGTTYGLSDAAVRSVKSRIFSAIGRADPEDHFSTTPKLQSIDLESRTATDFLRSHFRGIC